MKYSYTVTGGFHPDEPATFDGCATTIKGMALTMMERWAVSNGDEIDRGTMSIEMRGNGDLVFKALPKKGEDGLSPSECRREQEAEEFRKLRDAALARLRNQ